MIDAVVERQAFPKLSTVHKRPFHAHPSTLKSIRVALRTESSRAMWYKGQKENPVHAVPLILFAVPPRLMPSEGCQCVVS